MSAANVTGPLEIRPATEERWADVLTVFGARGDPSWCFCQSFIDPHWNQGKEINRESLRAQVASLDPVAGLLAYDGDDPVGWVQIGPRTRFPRANKRHAPTDGEWFLTCFVVPPRSRRQGVSGALLQGAIAHARDHGARVLRARPTDTIAGRRPGADLFTGVLSSFLAEGFVEVRRNHSRVTVELDLAQRLTAARRSSAPRRSAP